MVRRCFDTALARLSFGYVKSECIDQPGGNGEGAIACSGRLEQLRS